MLNKLVMDAVVLGADCEAHRFAAVLRGRGRSAEGSCAARGTVLGALHQMQRYRVICAFVTEAAELHSKLQCPTSI